MARRKTMRDGQGRIMNVVSTKTILRGKAFRLGYESAVRGEPWPKQYEAMNPAEQNEFEYGRLFGKACPGLVLKTGNRITEWARIWFEFAARRRL